MKASINREKMHVYWIIQSTAYKAVFFALILASCSPNLRQAGEGTKSINAQHLSGESRESTSQPDVHSVAASDDGALSACLKCHQYRENHHPVDFVPAHSSNFPFPLYEGKVECLTCHIENHRGSELHMLRGGPYSSRREICFKCHYEEDYAQIYPHSMLDNEGKIIEVNGKPVCVVCHVTTPDPTVDRTKDVLFRADVAFLCWRCHSLMAQPTLNERLSLFALK